MERYQDHFMFITVNEDAKEIDIEAKVRPGAAPNPPNNEWGRIHHALGDLMSDLPNLERQGSMVAAEDYAHIPRPIEEGRWGRGPNVPSCTARPFNTTMSTHDRVPIPRGEPGRILLLCVFGATWTTMSSCGRGARCSHTHGESDSQH